MRKMEHYTGFVIVKDGAASLKQTKMAPEIDQRRTFVVQFEFNFLDVPGVLSSALT